MSLRLEEEKDTEILRQAALLLERENQRLVKRVTELTQQLLALQGKDPAELQLELQRLQLQLEQVNKKLHGSTTERGPRHEEDEQEDPAPKPRRGHGRRRQSLREVDVPVPLSDEDRVCEKCGEQMTPWEGQFEESTQIGVVRREFVLERIKREKARCRCGCIQTAEAPPKLANGSAYSIDFAIEVALQKYDFHAPLARQARQMGGEGLVIDTQTLWDQIERLARIVAPAHDRLHQEVLARPILFADETHWKLMASDKERARRGRSDPDFAKKTWQVWTLVSDAGIYHRIQGSRGNEAGRRVLDGFRGVVMCDGYKVYSSLAAESETKFRLAHCWAHARREYKRIENSFPAEVNTILGLIGRLYAIERDVKPLDGEDMLAARTRARNEQSRKVLDEIAKWCQEVKTLPQSTLADAIRYTTNHWSGLTMFLDDARIPLDNNVAERANRAPVVGRKNHYGSRSRRGTEVAAILYSLIETARFHGVDAFRYLKEAALAGLRGEQVPLPRELAPDNDGSA